MDIEAKLEGLENRLALHETACARTSGRSEVLWEHQHKWCDRHDRDDALFHAVCERRMRDLGGRITAVEATVAKWAAVGGIIGAGFGGLIPYIVTWMQK